VRGILPQVLIFVFYFYFFYPLFTIHPDQAQCGAASISSSRISVLAFLIASKKTSAQEAAGAAVRREPRPWHRRNSGLRETVGGDLKNQKNQISLT